MVWVNEDGIGERTKSKKKGTLLEIGIRDDNILGTSMRLECSIVGDNNKVDKELKDEFKVVGKGKGDKWEESWMNKRVIYVEPKLTLVQILTFNETTNSCMLVSDSLHIEMKMLILTSRTLNLLMCHKSKTWMSNEAHKKEYLGGMNWKWVKWNENLTSVYRLVDRI